MAPLSPKDLNSILEATRPIWSEVAHQRVFLTGGTGFFGTWLTESFLHINEALRLDAQLTVLTRDPDSFRDKVKHLASNPALTLLQGDVRSFKFPSEKYEFILHAATEASAKQLAEHPHQMLSTLLAGTERVLSFASHSRARKLLLTSSGAVYGPQPPDLSHVSEDFAQAPDTLLAHSVYGEGKRVSELVCALAANPTLEVKIARCWAFVGPHLPLDSHFAAGNFLDDALNGRPINIAGDGTALRSYLYASDLTIWLWTILFRGRTLRAYNVGSEYAVSISELAQHVAALTQPPLQVTAAKQPVPGSLPVQYVPSTARARNELGLKQTISLPEALDRTMLWARQNRN